MAGSISALLIGALVLAAGPVAAQSYPTKPIRWIVPFPTSGATDILTRTIAHKLSEALGQPVIIDNKPGAGGALGSDLAAKAAPDGYTLLMATTSTHSIGPALQKLPYDAQRDFAAISEVADATNVLIVSPQLGVNSVKELIALAKSKPGQLNFSSSGTGAIPHLSGERFKHMTGTDIQHIPYKGTALAIPDIINGQIAMMFDSIVSVMPHIRSGKVKALAISSQKRSALLPELPTMIEAGVPGYVSDTYFGVFAPAASVLLPARIGQARAEDLLHSGRSIDASTALAWGLAHAVAEDPVALALEYFQNNLANKSAAALGFGVQAARSEFAAAANKRLLVVERLYLEELMKTHDAAEGLNAFLAKRQPRWEHR